MVKTRADTDTQTGSSAEPGAQASTANDTVLPSTETDDGAAPQILERGTIYFFFRARVNVDEPTSLDDVARTFLILQPDHGLPHDDEAEAEAVEELRRHGSCRLLALPKKVLPRTGRDRFMAFVLRAGMSYTELHNEYLAGGTYTVKSDDGAPKQQHMPAATAFAEGIYAIMTTGRETHMTYFLTFPVELGHVQRQLGLGPKHEGSFLVSTRNPAYPMPSGGPMVGGGPKYPKEIQESFRSLRWEPMRPEHLDYDNTHLLLIGEKDGTEKLFGESGVGHEDDEIGRATRDLSAELEEASEADLGRMRRLGSTETEAVLASLQTSKGKARGPSKLSEMSR